MTDDDRVAAGFEEHRTRLRAIAYRMLGSQTEADDAVQDTWLRLCRSDTDEIENIGGWLTTVVSRVCLNMLRARRTRREEPLEVHVPDPVVTRRDESSPEEEALLADAVGLAVLVVLDTLTPPERLAFVLHDLFAVPFEEIAPIIGRSSDATRQLASRGRRRVQGASLPDADVERQREVVAAFFAAARGGDFDALLAVLDPDVVVRSDGGTRRPALTSLTRGAESVAHRAMAFAQPAARLEPVLVNGAAGVVVVLDGQPFSVMGFTVSNAKITAIDVLADPERIANLDLSALARDS
jgi:RNA polymerase sigma-70 factor, ECF subfamily